MINDLVESLKENFKDQLGIYERKISNLNKVRSCNRKRVEQQNALIRSLLEEKKRDKLEIIHLQKKLEGVELENVRLERNSHTLHLTSEMRDRSSNMNTRRFGTDDSEIVFKDHVWRVSEPVIKTTCTPC